MGFSDRLKPATQTQNNTEKSKIHEKEKREATERNEPWVAVLDTHVNSDNIKNGFFEMDWNDKFIDVLLDEGFTGDTQEEIVEKWFNIVIMNMLEEEGIQAPVESGNVATFLKK